MCVEVDFHSSSSIHQSFTTAHKTLSSLMSQMKSKRGPIFEIWILMAWHKICRRRSSVYILSNWIGWHTNDRTIWNLKASCIQANSVSVLKNFFFSVISKKYVICNPSNGHNNISSPSWFLLQIEYHAWCFQSVIVVANHFNLRKSAIKESLLFFCWNSHKSFHSFDLLLVAASLFWTQKHRNSNTK